MKSGERLYLWMFVSKNFFSLEMISFQMSTSKCPCQQNRNRLIFFFFGLAILLSRYIFPLKRKGQNTMSFSLLQKLNFF